MKLLIEFDVYSDIVDVPEVVIKDIQKYRNKFLDWLYNPKIKHKHWRKELEPNGRKSYYVCYGSDAFIEWLNAKVLKDSEEKATLVESETEYDGNEYPKIFF